jgi:hypothetical protein
MKRLALILIAMLFILPLALTACEEGGQYESVPTSPMAPIPAPAEPGKSEVDMSSGAEPAPLPEERMIVRNGDISLVVEDVLETRDEIAQLAERLGGYVVTSNIYGEGEEETRGSISIRVPSDKFDQALGELRGLALRVTSESTSTEDITEQYVDLQSRLRNAEATESQYLALLDTATRVEDILAIYESLSQIRYEIEQIKGRMQYLERTSAMSLISINLEPAITLRPLVSPVWSARETLNTAVRGLTTFGQGLGTAFIWIGILSPIWGTALGIALWRRRRRKRAQSLEKSRTSTSS